MHGYEGKHDEAFIFQRLSAAFQASVLTRVFPWINKINNPECRVDQPLL